MKIHCLGTAGYHPSESRQTSCYFLPAAGLVLDAGTGIYRLPALIETDQLDIFLSHAHLDHIAGLTFLLDILHQRPVERVRVWGEAEKIAAIQQHLFSELIFPVELDVEWKVLLPGTSVQVGCGGMLHHFPLVHPGGSLGFRIDWPGSSLCYVTDTTASPDASYKKQIKGCRLLLHECNFTDDLHAWAIKTGHSSTSHVATIAKDANVEQLLLVHINPIADEIDPVDIALARSIFPNTSIAEDHLVIEF